MAMIRKQIYVEKRQELSLKRLARRLGLSEAEIIRSAIDQFTQMRNSTLLTAKNRTMWEAAKKFALAADKRPVLPPNLTRTRRDDYYDDRMEKLWRES